MDSLKTFDFYFQGMLQQLAVVVGTEPDAIDKTIRQLLKINEEQKIKYLLSDGTPLVLTSHLPNKIKIHVELEKDLAFEAVAATPTASWVWQKPRTWNGDEESTTHFLKNENRTVYQPINKSQCPCLGNKPFSSGKYYWTLLIEPLQCCVHAGVLDSAKSTTSLCEQQFWRLWEKLGQDPHGKFPGPTVVAGFLLDMEKKILRITDHNSQQVLAEHQVSSFVVYPAVLFKHEVSVTIQEASIPVPQWAAVRKVI